MKCRTVPDLADDYLDREGPLSVRLGVGWHLVICRHCRAYVRGLDATRRFTAESVRREDTDRVLRAIGAGSPGDRHSGSPR